METDPRNGMQILSESECHALLAAAEIGRLAVAPGGRPEIFPVNYLWDNDHVVFRTAEGSKLSSLAVNHAVAFEIDGLDLDRNEAWSVTLTGLARMVESDDRSAELESLPLHPWNLAQRDHFVEIRPDQVSGRRFVAEGRTRAED